MSPSQPMITQTSYTRLHHVYNVKMKQMVLLMTSLLLQRIVVWLLSEGHAQAANVWKESAVGENSATAASPVSRAIKQATKRTNVGNWASESRHHTLESAVLHCSLINAAHLNYQTQKVVWLTDFQIGGKRRVVHSEMSRFFRPLFHCPADM